MKLQCFIWLNITFNAAAIAFKSRFTYYFRATIINLALVGFLCNLGVQYIIRGFLSIQKISRLSFFFRENVFSNEILITGLVAFTHVEFMLLM